MKARKMTMKRLYGTLLAAFVAMMLLATYVSNQIYLRALPTVETVYEAQQTLRNIYSVQATVVYDDVITLRTPCVLTLKDVHKRAGEAVRRGEALLTYTMDGLQLALLTALKNMETYEAQAAQSQAGRATRQFYKEQAETEQQMATSLQILIAKDGVVASTVNGYVATVYASPGDRIAEYGRVMAIHHQDGPKEIQFTTSALQYDFSQVTLDLPVYNGTSVENQTQTLIITRKQYDAAMNAMRYSARVPASLQLEAYPGQQVSGTLQTSSTEYAHTLPNACLHEDGTGRQYVYLVLKKETVRGEITYVQQRTVYVLEKDEMNFAYTTVLTDPVVVHYSLELTDLCEVSTI